MKRINPNTGKPFKKGDMRGDGYVFSTYLKSLPLNETGLFKEQWLTPEKLARHRKQVKDWEINSRSTKQGQIKNVVCKTKSRAIKQKIPFNLTVEYLEKIAPEKCPVLGVCLSWGGVLNGHQPTTPSLDKIVPELGYIEGNVQWVSYKANAMKSNASFKELHQFADWIKKSIPLS